MYREIWRKAHRSVAQISFYTHEGISILSVTGFKVRDYLVTDAYVGRISKFDHVEIKFVEKDGITVRAIKRLSREAFIDSMVVGLSDKFHDIVLLSLDFEEFVEIPSLALCDECHIEIGEPVAIIGYQLGQDNASVKQGILSSYHVSGEIKYLQIDATIRHGNAGSPVISLESGYVVGMIGHKLTEISQSYSNIKQIMNNNLQLLKQYQGRYNMDDIDPVQVLIANQNQIKYITKEIYRMASMGVGYAMPSQQIVSFFKENLIMEEKVDQSKNILAGF